MAGESLTLGFIGGVGVQELLIILLIVFLLFGARKLPEIMRSFGQGIREFKKESRRIVSGVGSHGGHKREQEQSESPAGDLPQDDEGDAPVQVRDRAAPHARTT